MNNILLKNPSLTHHRVINKLCKPLEKLNISYFSHVHVDEQDLFSVICNNPDFIELYYQNEYFNIDLHTANVNEFGQYVIWDNLPRAGKTLKMGDDARDLGIIHTFTIIKKDTTGNHFFHFSTHIQDEIMNQNYLTNLNLLEIFISYFREEVKKSNYLSSAHQLKIEIDSQEKGYVLQNNLHLLNQQEKDLFLKLLKENRNDFVNLTNREIQCLKVYALGKTAKEVGDILGISKRTVEHYLHSSKQKLQVFSKSELIGRVLENNIY